MIMCNAQDSQNKPLLYYSYLSSSILVSIIPYCACLPLPFISQDVGSCFSQFSVLTLGIITRSEVLHQEPVFQSVRHMDNIHFTWMCCIRNINEWYRKTHVGMKCTSWSCQKSLYGITYISARSRKICRILKGRAEETIQVRSMSGTWYKIWRCQSLWVWWIS